VSEEIPSAAGLWDDPARSSLAFTRVEVSGVLENWEWALRFLSNRREEWGGRFVVFANAGEGVEGQSIGLEMLTGLNREEVIG